MIYFYFIAGHTVFTPHRNPLNPTLHPNTVTKYLNFKPPVYANSFREAPKTK